MGLNIHLNNLIDGIHKAKAVEFDSFRYGGDREYGAAKLEWEYKTCGNVYCCDYLYKRPKDFETHRSWIKQNIIEANQNRLLAALDTMEKDENIYFEFSY